MNESTLKPWTPVISSCGNLKRRKTEYNVKKPHTLGCDLRGAGIICLMCFFKKLYPLRPRESAKNHSCRRFAIMIQCLPCILLGCVLIIAKVSLSRAGTQSEGNEPRHRNLSKGIWLIICFKAKLCIFTHFFQQHQTCQLQPMTFVPPIQRVQ